MLDLKQEKDAHIDQRLRTETIIWLGSVRPDGRPHLVPVWFLWDGSNVLIFSQPNNQKIRNLRNNKYVTLALEAAQGGSDIVVLEGTAELVDNFDAGTIQPPYAQKYAAQIQAMGWTVESMAKDFSQLIRITPTKFR